MVSATNQEHVGPVVHLMGPTASGKTDLAVHLVERLPCDIVSVDSAMVYRGMDIGTAKPDAATLARAPHRLIDIRDPADAYSAAEFAADAAREIRAIRAAGRMPLLVGGTMLYFRALTRGLSPLPPADAGVREALTAEADRHGWQALHARLASRDPDTAARIHPNDAQRIQRALEILELTGQPPSHWYARRTESGPEWPLVELAVAPSARSRLHERIETRFDAMLAAGFLGEVEKLHARPDLTLDTPALRAVGYRQLWQHLDGTLSWAEARDRGVYASRQLAKRQLTWLRRERGVRWFDSDDPGCRERVLREVAIQVAPQHGVLP
ncbi:tRNA (adenosine(37)-N6)-dimethylallyltransferase MiaA [Salinisphaera sp. PC39]|uniref:tRNA (adenosine(37)-N6)-dimethylallyltransferase MiaA n=1 Tax=Salinisphaera sp. PC39 TaxID=1304156 RepID=UPI0033405C98